ncbi:MAG: flagellar filament capping protein FliD [Planctomycetota bacterium]|nr:flagellar filament capping protein FliD [Planctomycetota bacterium]
MSSLSIGTGLISGLDFTSIVSALTTSSQTAIARLQQRAQAFDTKNTALNLVQTSLLTLKASTQMLNTESSFSKFAVSNSSPAQMNVTAGTDSLTGSYSLRSLRLASTNSLQSTGFAHVGQTLGTGTITIARGGRLNPETLLGALNNGNGAQRGKIRITDRSGASADIDLSKAYTVTDVLNAINDAEAISVTATVENGHFVLTDTSGSTSSNLIVANLSGGKTADDLGIKQSVAANTLAGSDVYSLSSNFKLSLLNDGNGMRLIDNVVDLRVTAKDGTEIDIDLNAAVTIGEVVDAINNHETNAGKVTAALVDGRLTLTDNTGGGGTLAVENLNTASVVDELGLSDAEVGGVITGHRLLAGMNSVLLKNLRGGQGIDQLGDLTLTDRTGTSATIDLSNAESIDEILTAINGATSVGAVKLQLTARVNSTGTGIEIIDTSGSTANNLVIADVGGSTLAEQLGIEIDAATTSVNSGSLGLRTVNHATALSTFGPGQTDVGTGTILITDTAGNAASVVFTSGTQTIGDIIQRINAADGVQVRAELNDTGDGIVLIDEAGGAGSLGVQDVIGTTAEKLRIAGSGTTGGDGFERISGRQATVISVEESDTLQTIVDKINALKDHATASLVNDGSAFNSIHLKIDSRYSGKQGELILDFSGFSLDFSELSAGQDALLQVGNSTGGSYIVASRSNDFQDVAADLDVTLLDVGATSAQVVLTKDVGSIKTSIANFVTNYNKLIDQTTSLTKFDSSTNARGVLQGDGAILRVLTRLSSAVTRNYFGTTADIRSFSDLGVRITTDGKLSFNTEQFDQLAADDPDGITQFFLDENNGAGKELNETLDSLTDDKTGTFHYQITANTDSIEDLSTRILQLQNLLEKRKDRLLQQFYNMETALSALQAQQQSLSALSVIKSTAK